MKKIAIFSISGIVLAIALFTSCSGSIDSKPTLKNDTDSLAYAMGVNLYESSLNTFLMRSGLVNDTSSVRRYFEQQIAEEKDDAKKEELKKKMTFQIDSVNRANNKNIAEFIRGFQEGIKAPDAQDAYINGLGIGRQISARMLPGLTAQLYGEKADSIKLNKDYLLSGLANSILNKKHVMEGASMYMETKMTEVEQKQREAQMKAQEAQMKAQEAQKGEKDAAQQKFFEENAKQAGVVTLPSGLQYKVITNGTGAKPKTTDAVIVHYKGTLIDGTVFESSYDGGEPISFTVGGVIKGWTEALQLMPVGSKWILYIPYDLAYGPTGSGKIPPYTPLVFEVELIGIK